jgi:hypothetical protein
MNPANTSITTKRYQVGAHGVNLDETIRHFNGVQDGRIPAYAAENEPDYTNFSFIWVDDMFDPSIDCFRKFFKVPRRLITQASGAGEIRHRLPVLGQFGQGLLSFF